jgi:hypothetical protein
MVKGELKCVPRVSINEDELESENDEEEEEEEKNNNPELAQSDSHASRMRDEYRRYDEALTSAWRRGR